MREIKFRGKRVDNGEWVYGLPVNYCNKTYILVLTDFEEERVYEQYPHKEMWPYEVIPETVGQYTGLKDTNGQRIFEGDIISYLHDDWIEPEVGVVKYMSDDGYPAFELEHSPVFDDEHYVVECNMLALLDQSGDYSYFVAGNIYDNPELMGETK